jgi:hypothetical protein
MASSVDISAGASIPPPTFTTSSFPALLGELFTWGVMIAGVLAVVFIALAGFQYMITSSFTQKINLKKRLTDIFLGLGLALATFLILNTINPQLLTVSFSKFGEGEELGGPKDPSLGIVKPYNPATAGPGDDGLETEFDGSSFTSNQLRMDNDGINPPPFRDDYYQPRTSLPGLDANVDPYVVVPIGSSIPLGTRVTLTNNSTGAVVHAIVGDRGPTKNGHGEVSRAALVGLGLWRPGMGDSVLPGSVTFNYHYNTD